MWPITLILALVAVGGGWYLWHRSDPGEQAAGMSPGGPAHLTPIVVEAATTADFPVRLSAIGTVVPRTVVTVRTRVDGTLDRLFFEEGQSVHAGELLAEIDPRPFEVALTQVQGQLARDEALLINARADLSRYDGLAKLDAIPVQQLDTQRALVRQYEAAVKTDRGAVDNARLQLSYTRITAPNDGRVGLRLVDPGNMVHASDANGLVIITQVQPVTVVFPIPEVELSKVLARLGLQTPPVNRRQYGEKIGGGRFPAGGVVQAAAQPGKARGTGLVVEAWDRDGKNLLATGELLTVDNQIDVTTGTVKVKAIFPNRDGALFPNQFVNVRMVVNELKDATVIPAAAVQRGARGTFVWSLKEDKTVAMQLVELGTADGDMIPVLKGLQAGERVAVDGFDRLRDGGKVEVVTRESRAVKSGPGNGRGKRVGADATATAAPGAPVTTAAPAASSAIPPAAPASTPATGK